MDLSRLRWKSDPGAANTTLPDHLGWWTVRGLSESLLPVSGDYSPVNAIALYSAPDAGGREA